MKKEKQFKLTNLAVDNRITIYIFIIILMVVGVYSYNSTSKEQFPEVSVPFFSVTTIYPGTSPGDIENLITRPIEKKIKTVDDIKHVYAQSIQDVSIIFVEFEIEVNEDKAKQAIKDAIDEAKTDLPNNLLEDSKVFQINFSEIPILYINLSGDLSLPRIKEYADEMQDEIEGMTCITRVDIVGALDREIQINVDLFKMQAAGVNFNLISAAVANENLTISGGKIDMENMQRNLRILGEFSNIEEIQNIIVKPGVYLKDIADVVDGFEERESYSRLFDKDVITLNVIKKGSANLIDAVDRANEKVENYKKKVSKNLNITTTGDMSLNTRHSVTNLFNTIIMGFLVVMVVLMFFMGIDNSLFAASAVPLSMLVAFIVIPLLGFTMNMVVQMAFIIAIGILVDNSIVVVENIYRHYMTTPDLPIIPAVKRAVGEVAIPILSGTLTTIAPFAVLAFWPGMMGKFIVYLPVTLIICLLSSLLVAYVINPVFAVAFMKYRKNQGKSINIKKRLLISTISLVIAAVFYSIDKMLFANIIVFTNIIYYLVSFLIQPLIKRFQKKAIPKIIKGYTKLITKAVKGKNPTWILMFAIILLFFTFFLLSVRSPKVVVMPESDPSQIMIYLKMPSGTSVDITDSVVKEIAKDVKSVLGENNPNVEFVNTNVAIGAGESFFDRNAQANLGKITIGFVEFQYREGDLSTRDYLNKIRETIKPIPGAEIIVDEQQKGPPTGSPISIEISGDDLGEIVSIQKNIEKIIKNENILGIEDLKSDLDINNPELIIEIDRRKANEMGISTANIGMTLRTALYGNEVSKIKDSEDEYPIQLRLKKKYRDNIDALMNMNIYAPGGPNGVKAVPLSSLADIRYSNSYGGILRKDYKRVVTLSSNVLSGYNANNIIKELTSAFNNQLNLKEGYAINFTGEKDTQKEMMDFLNFALLLAVGLIFLILVTQFNSFVKPIIVLTQILLSFIGIFLGIIIFDMDISIMLTGMGIVAVAGIVVNNGILLIDYADKLLAKGYYLRDAIIEAGSTRLTPVLLTAISTIIGLLPLAIGMNINFETLMTELRPSIYWGGDSAQFWGPLAWTIIFGLSFATVLTLFVVPSMYYLFNRKSAKVREIKEKVQKKLIK